MSPGSEWKMSYLTFSVVVLVMVSSTYTATIFDNSECLIFTAVVISYVHINTSEVQVQYLIILCMFDHFHFQQSVGHYVNVKIV